MANVNTNLSDAQVEAMERILTNWYDKHIGNLANHTIDGRVWRGLLNKGLITYDHVSGDINMPPYAIQSLCATILTKYDGATHERIHGNLSNYQRLFNS